MALATPAGMQRCIAKPPSSLRRLALSSTRSLPCSQAFSTTSSRAARGFANPNLNAPPEVQPPYPHGPERWFKSANRGLYGNVRLRMGNNVSEEHQTKTRRRWYPNVHSKRLWSESLERFVRVRVVIRVLRTIDKVGGLDSYLLGQTPGRLRELGTTGWALRWRVIRSPKGQEMWQKERKRLGLAGPSPRDEAWANPLAEAMGTLRGLPPPAEAQAGAFAAESDEALAARERAIDEELDRLDQDETGGIDLTEETVQPGRKKPGFGGLFNRN